MTGPAATQSAGGNSSPGLPKSAVGVTLFTSKGCHYCQHARDVLDSIQNDHPLLVTEISLESDEGQAALRRWRVPFPPLLLIDGDLFGYGRISARKLQRRLGA